MATAAKNAAKRKSLSLKEKNDIIKKAEDNPALSTTSIGDSFGISHTTVASVLNNKVKYKQLFFQSKTDVSRKRVRSAKFELKATELLFLPPNSTSKTQPLDQGIVRNVKLHYQNAHLMQLVAHLDAGIPRKEFSINILQALTMLRDAWDQVLPETISNCFRKAGFTCTKSSSIESADRPHDNIPLQPEPLLSRLFEEYNISPQAFFTVDDDVVTAKPYSPRKEAASTAATPADSTNSYSDDDSGEPQKPVSKKKLLDSMNCLNAFCMQNDVGDEIMKQVRMMTFSLQKHVARLGTQKTIPLFFKETPGTSKGRFKEHDQKNWQWEEGGDGVSGQSEEGDGGSIQSEEGDGGSVRSEEGDGGSVQSEHDDGGSVQSEHDDGVSVQSEHDDGGSVQSEHDDGVSVQSEHDDGGSVQSEHDDGVSVQSEHDDGVSVQSEHDDGVSVQSEHDDGVSVQSEHDDGVSVQSEHDDGVSVQSEHDGGVSVQSEHDDRVSVQSEHDDGVSVQSEHDDGVSVQSEHDDGVSVQSEHDDGVSVQSEHDDGVSVRSEESDGRSGQSEHDNGVSVQSEHDDGVSVQSEHDNGSEEGDGVSGQSEEGDGESEQSEEGDGVSVQSEEGDGVSGQSEEGDGGSGQSEEGDGVSGQSEEGDGVSVQSEEGDGVSGQSEEGDGVSGQSEEGDGGSVRSEEGDGGSVQSEEGDGESGQSDGENEEKSEEGLGKSIWREETIEGEEERLEGKAQKRREKGWKPDNEKAGASKKRKLLEEKAGASGGVRECEAEDGEDNNYICITAFHPPKEQAFAPTNQEWRAVQCKRLKFPILMIGSLRHRPHQSSLGIPNSVDTMLGTATACIEP
ncbi:hypothetical protein ACOMHN_056416 [Nucella lapillus]